jgi:hypothetical protein
MGTTDILTAINIVISIIIFGVTIYSNIKIENIKAEIDLQNNRKKIIFEEEKSAIYSFYTNFKLWYEANNNFSEYAFKDFEKIDKIETILNEKLNVVRTDFSKLELFIDDPKIISSAKDLIYQTQLLQEINIRYRNKIMFDLEQWHEIQYELRNGLVYEEQIKRNENEIETILHEYDTVFEPQYLSILPLQHAILKELKEYIRNEQ